jgi:hypothetical protein
MAQSGKEKQAKYRAKMRNAGYKLVQLWVRDQESEEFKKYIKELESGVRRPKTSLRWNCERVVLEIHVKSRDVAVRERKIHGFMRSLLSKVADGYEGTEIPKYVYVDIVELLRPLSGEDLYVQYKTRYEGIKISRRAKMFCAILTELGLGLELEDEDDFTDWLE